MDQAPPYSATASSNERCLPEGSFPQDETDVLSSLTRPKAILGHGDGCPAEPDAQGGEDDTPRPILNGPFPSMSSSEAPPDYTRFDALASSFRLEAPLIYTTKTSNMPRYQLKQEFTRTGKPRRLAIRRLMPQESRSYSLPSLSTKARGLEFDEDGTMYAISTNVYGWSTLSGLEMRGHRLSTLAGVIKLETSLLGGGWTKIWHVTRNMKRDSLNPDNDAKIQKYGYHADDEWDKSLLYVIKRGQWADNGGKAVAVEEGDGSGRKFEIVAEDVNGPKTDLLVSCWVMRLWAKGDLRWEDDVGQ